MNQGQKLQLWSKDASTRLTPYEEFSLQDVALSQVDDESMARREELTWN